MRDPRLNDRGQKSPSPRRNGGGGGGCFLIDKFSRHDDFHFDAALGGSDQFIAGEIVGQKINAERAFPLHRALYRRPSKYRIKTIMRMVPIMPCER
jgi:hypothetical protein